MINKLPPPNGFWIKISMKDFTGRNSINFEYMSRELIGGRFGIALQVLLTYATGRSHPSIPSGIKRAFSIGIPGVGEVNIIPIPLITPIPRCLVIQLTVAGAY